MIDSVSTATGGTVESDITFEYSLVSLGTITFLSGPDTLFDCLVASKDDRSLGGFETGAANGLLSLRSELDCTSA